MEELPKKAFVIENHNFKCADFNTCTRSMFTVLCNNYFVKIYLYYFSFGPLNLIMTPFHPAAELATLDFNLRCTEKSVVSVPPI